MNININEIKDYINNPENTGYMISKKTGINTGHIYKYKSGKISLESMSLRLAVQMQQAINREKKGASE